jgi:WD40 repeat protein
VGNTDGTLALYDVRKHGNSPAVKTTVSTGQHTGTIWEVKWVERGKGRGENLISISADGRVLEWTRKKGLERNAPDLMKLKRMPSKQYEGQNSRIGHGGSGREALLSRQSGGMCFDINPKEQITYVVGTEDGTLHKCSKSQSENYIMDYKPHEEPVYRIRWSPFCSHYFLTCSADWTSRLYHVDRPDPIVTLDSNKQDAVHDVAWSNTNSTIFAAATANGHVDIWDIADPIQPRCTLELEGRSLNCITFADQESPVVCVGDNCGDVSVVKLNGIEFERGGLSDRDQYDRFQEVVKKIST